MYGVTDRSGHGSRCGLKFEHCFFAARLNSQPTRMSDRLLVFLDLIDVIRTNNRINKIPVFENQDILDI